MHGQAVVVARFLAITRAGCIGDDIETIPLFLDAGALDTDKDGEREVVFDLSSGNGNAYGIRVAASGTMAIERAPAPGDDHSAFAGATHRPVTSPLPIIPHNPHTSDRSTHTPGRPPT